MNDDNLIRMANQIGVFFESMPDRVEALEGIATHLKKFWDPRMRRAFLALVDGDRAAHVSEIVRSAVREHRAMLASIATANTLTANTPAHALKPA